MCRLLHQAKWPRRLAVRTSPFQGEDHGFESRRGHWLSTSPLSFSSELYYTFSGILYYRQSNNLLSMGKMCFWVVLTNSEEERKERLVNYG